MEVPDNYKDNVMHSVLRFENAVIMGADNMPDNKAEHGNSLSILVDVIDDKNAERYFNNLAEGAVIIMPFETQFWDAKFGMLQDKFGFLWGINCELKR